MAKSSFSLSEDYENFLCDDELEFESDDGSMVDSMDSEEEDAFQHGIDRVLDIEEDSSSTPLYDVSSTSSEPLPEPSTSTDIPHTSTEEQANVNGTGSTSPPPGKRRLLTPPSSSSSPSPKSSPVTSPIRKPSVRNMCTTSSSSTAPAPAAAPDRWRDLTELDQQPPPLQFCPRRTPGVQLDFRLHCGALDIFRLFFSEELIQTLCSNTNKYAAQRKARSRKRSWTDVNADEMLHFLSIVLYLGLVKTSPARDLWRKGRLHSPQFPASLMTWYRFEAINAYLHMSDPAADAENDQLRGQPQYDELFRLKPLLDTILNACWAYYQPQQNLYIYEHLVANKPSIGIKQYKKAKTTKWGYKLVVLADCSSGYTCSFSIHNGKERKRSANGQSFDAVVNLLHMPSLGTGYTVYVDDVYTSPPLFRHLHKIGLGACGTIRETRMGLTTVNALPKKVERGEMRWIRDGPLLFVKWRDTRDVTMCSTVHKAYSQRCLQRRLRSQNDTWSSKLIPVPDPVKAYNKFRGGVDLSDAHIKYFPVTQSTRRWYMKLFLHIVDIVVVNSFIIHKDLARENQLKPLTQKRFREVLCMELAAVGQPQVSTTVTPVSSEASSSSQPQAPEPKPKGCFPAPVCEISPDPRLKASLGRRKCVHCKMKTMFLCRACNVPLCIVVDRMCFTEWHDQNGPAELCTLRKRREAKILL